MGTTTDPPVTPARSPIAEASDDQLPVTLEAEDVWVVGQLLDADAVDLPPGVERQIREAYRILKATGFSPGGADEPSAVDLRFDTDGVAESLGDHEAPGDLEPGQRFREVVVREVDPDEADALAGAREVLVEEVPAEDPAPDATEPAPRRAGGAAHGVEGAARADEVPTVQLADREAERERLAEAIEDAASTVARRIEAAGERAAEPAPASASPPALGVDAVLSGAAVLVASVFAVAAALGSDPVFGALAVAVLVFAALHARRLRDAPTEGS